MDRAHLLSPDRPMALVRSRAPAHPGPEVLAVEVRKAISRRQRLLVATHGCPEPLLACLVPSLAYALRMRRRVLVVVAQTTALERTFSFDIPLLQQAFNTTIPTVAVRQPEDFDALTLAREALVIVTRYEVLAWHLKLLEHTDLEMLPMPEIVILDAVDASVETLRQGMGFGVSTRGLELLAADLPKLGQAPLATLLLNAIGRLTTRLRARQQAGIQSGAELTQGLEIRALLRGLVDAEKAYTAAAAQLEDNIPYLARAERCQLAILRLHQLLEPGDGWTVTLIAHQDGLTLQAVPHTIAPALNAGMFDHVRCVVALSSSLPTEGALTSTKAALGLLDAQSPVIPQADTAGDSAQHSSSKQGDA